MPVICGGTNYYIESLLWNVLVDSPSKKTNSEEEVFEEWNELNNKDLYLKLCEIDPERAHELHPNERRKILRSLQGKFYIQISKNVCIAATLNLL